MSAIIMFTDGEINKLEASFQKATKLMESNPPNGIWGKYDHFLSCLNWHMDEDTLCNVDVWYQIRITREV